MTTLNLKPNIAEVDGFYTALLAAHDGLSEAETHAFNARLILIFANHIGDTAVLTEALETAKKNERE